MVAVRHYWKGYIKLALVSCPISLFTATSGTERVAFRQVNRKTGNRLRQQLIDDQTREPVEAADKARGFEYTKNAFILIEDEEIEAVEIDSSHTIDIDTFVPRSEIDERFCDSPYYIAPNAPVGHEAFAVIREAMRDKSMVALGRVVLSKRERVMMLQPWGKGMLGMTLRYPYEIRDAEDYFNEIPDLKVAPELLKLAEHILATKEAKFDPTKFVDRYEEALVEMLDAKRKGLPAAVRTIAPPQSAPDLFAALRASISEEQRLKAANTDKAPPQAKPKSKAKPAPKLPKPRVDGQREMLLPIPGKKAAEEKKLMPASAPRRKAS